MAKTTIFDLSSDQKKLIADISTLCGVKQEIVMLVWQHTLYVNYLNLLEDSKKPHSRLQIPLLGSIVVRHDADGELSPIILMTDQIKEMLSKVKKGQDVGLIEYFQEKFIDCIVDDLDDSVG